MNINLIITPSLVSFDVLNRYMSWVINGVVLAKNIGLWKKLSSVNCSANSNLFFKLKIPVLNMRNIFKDQRKVNQRHMQKHKEINIETTTINRCLYNIPSFAIQVPESSVASCMCFCKYSHYRISYQRLISKISGYFFMSGYFIDYLNHSKFFVK